MDLGIKGKSALVCAASRGLGFAAALKLAAEGANVTICSRDEKRLADAGKRIAAAPGVRDTAVKTVPADVADTDQVRYLVSETAAAFGGVDILVCNAGGPPAGTVDDLTPGDYRAEIELNLMSTVTLCYEAVPHMKKKGWGRIVAVTSISAKQPIDNLVLSNTARAGVLGFCKSLSNSLAHRGITVNTLCPGYTRTERIDELAAEFVKRGAGTVEDYYRKAEAEIPAGRMGLPEEFADAVAFLVSERASYITGVVLPVDGGRIRSIF